MQEANSEIDNLINRRINTNNSKNHYFKIGDISNKNITQLPSYDAGVIDKNAQPDFYAGLVRDTYELSTKDEYNNLMEPLLYSRLMIPIVSNGIYK